MLSALKKQIVVKLFDIDILISYLNHIKYLYNVPSISFAKEKPNCEA